MENSRITRTVVGVGAVVLGAGVAEAKKHVVIEPMKHDVQEVQARNFDAIISKNRDVGVSGVWYFKASNAADGKFLSTWNAVAQKTKHMIKVAAVNCEEHEKQCKLAGVTETPHIHIYPPQPEPAFQYKGELKEETLLKALYKKVVNKVNTLADAKALSEWKAKNPTKPKVILFSEKDKTPLILKGLSSETVFHRTVDFAFVSTKASEDLAKEAKGKKLPAVQLIKNGKKQWYKNGKAKPDDLSFGSLHEWINVVSESGMGDAVKSSGETQTVDDVQDAYVEEKVRELHAKSHRELCFGQKNVCAIYVSDGPMDDATTDMVAELGEKFSGTGDRSIKYNWMWMDASVETGYKKAIQDAEDKAAKKEDRDAEPTKYPTLIFVKPPKKKREERFLAFVRLGNGVGINDSNVEAITEKIAGGTSYNRVELPSFIVRKKAAKKAAKEEL